MKKSFVVASTVICCAVSCGTASSLAAEMRAIDALADHSNQLEGLTDSRERTASLAGLTPTAMGIQEAVLQPQLLGTVPVTPVQKLGAVGDLDSVLADNYVSASRSVVRRAHSQPRGLARVALMVGVPALLAGLAGLMLAVIRRSA